MKDNMYLQDMIHMGKESSRRPQEVLDMAEKTFSNHGIFIEGLRSQGYIQSLFASALPQG